MIDYNAKNKDEAEAEVALLFEKADADKDGALDEDEFVNFRQMQQESFKGKFGAAIEFTEQELRDQYEHNYSKLEESHYGVTMDDLKIAQGVWANMKNERTVKDDD